MSGIHPSRKAYVEDAEEEMLDLANVPIDRDYVIPSTGRAGIAPEKASAILSQMDRKKRAAAIVVPTDDGRVRMRLRELGEPITLFGEGPGDRRDRLRELLYERQEGGGAGGEDIEMGDAEEEEDHDDDDEEYYTPGEPELLEARKKIAYYSIPRARDRVAMQKEEATVPLQKHIKHRRAIKEHLGGYQVLGSQIAGDRPVSIARFSPDSKLIAAGSWSGTIRMLGVPDLEEKGMLRGHTDRIGGISWHPEATKTMSPESVNLATGGGEGKIHLWNLKQQTPLATLEGHSARVCRIEHHPSGQYLASASFDTTWRLWDLETQKELLLQEGHSREVYSIAFQDDGALIASGGLDSIGRVWDLRTGRTIMVLDGHIREITGLAWHPDGYRVLSSSGDASVKVWDVRMVRCTATIGAHKKLVSDIRFFRGDGAGSGLPSEMKTQGTYFVTGGFDGGVNIHSCDDWAYVKGLNAHSGNVTSVDVSLDGKFIVSSGQDRTCKLWAREDIEL
ncbi:WD40-repeat-containing domain protein [Pyronema domesticum]|uniref:Similar to U4/U6 small nuclear ribonucleoprotein Prp4 acc. no. O43172 n=1 Tax=Pyronema omphalodes (strain CBS 100304) TaxID=1076935 RepID=U4LVR8_PYROM|nr:WD40-repeat-containing domain protein [Pyronema domesticum]CCX34802.1 Similar to U4/U6 small nuclear ribonucleoprotein Prp4; acc. no. O43172 [Pyronema omphalodes CBS 100304]